MTPATRAAREALEKLEAVAASLESAAADATGEAVLLHPFWLRVRVDQIRAALSLLAAPGREDLIDLADRLAAAVCSVAVQRGPAAWDGIASAVEAYLEARALPAAPAQEREASIREAKNPPAPAGSMPKPTQPRPRSPVPPAGAPGPERGFPVFDPEAVERVVAKMDKPRPEWDRPRAGGVLPLDPYSPVRTAPALRPEPGADLLARVRDMMDAIDGITARDEETGRRGYVDLRTQARHFSTGLDTLDAAYRDVLAALQARERGDG